MTTHRLRTRRSSLREKTTPGVMPQTPFKQEQQIQSFLRSLESGRMPNFLELLEVLSTVSEFVTPDGTCPDCRI